jgi:hypothetical protein
MLFKFWIRIKNRCEDCEFEIEALKKRLAIRETQLSDAIRTSSQLRREVRKTGK